jgi:hypothetical protein
MLKPLPLFWIVIIIKDLMIIEDGDDIVRIYDVFKLTSLLKFKLID